MASCGFLASANAASVIEPVVLLPCLGGVLIQSFLMSPDSNRSKYRKISRWSGESSIAGIVA